MLIIPYSIMGRIFLRTPMLPVDVDVEVDLPAHNYAAGDESSPIIISISASSGPAINDSAAVPDAADAQPDAADAGGSGHADRFRATTLSGVAHRTEPHRTEQSWDESEQNVVPLGATRARRTRAGRTAPRPAALAIRPAVVFPSQTMVVPTEQRGTSRARLERSCSGRPGNVFCCFPCLTETSKLTPLALRHDFISPNFKGRTGGASLFDKVLNISYSAPEKQEMTTGVFIVKRVHCLVCRENLGWSYCRAWEPSQRYKEGRCILEDSLVMW